MKKTEKSISSTPCDAALSLEFRDLVRDLSRMHEKLTSVNNK